MTQEKQTSIRILQSKPTKKSLGKPTIFLLGLLTGIIFSSIFFLAFTNINSSKNIDVTSDETQITEEVHQRHVPNDDNTVSDHDENAVAYKQHINEKDFNKIFKHENKPNEPKNPSGSPFEQILKPDNKPVVSTPLKAPVPIAKPAVSQAKPKVAPTTKAEVKPVEEEISPEGSVKISIDRKVVEDKP